MFIFLTAGLICHFGKSCSKHDHAFKTPVIYSIVFCLAVEQFHLLMRLIRVK